MADRARLVSHRDRKADVWARLFGKAPYSEAAPIEGVAAECAAGMGRMDGLGAHYATGSPGRDDRWEKDGVVRQMLREALDSRRDELAEFLVSQFGRDDRFQRMLLALLTTSRARSAKKAPPEEGSGRHRMLGESPAMRGVLAAIQKFALTDVPVLIG